MDGTGSGPCSVVDFGVNSVEFSVSAARKLVIQNLDCKFSWKETTWVTIF